MLRCWPGSQANSSTSEGGTSKVRATESSVSSSIAATRSAWKVADTQCALKWSNGSRHERHTHSDLHAVDPKRLDSRVSGDPHCGHRTDSSTGTGPAAGPGGATPYDASLAFAS